MQPLTPEQVQAAADALASAVATSATQAGQTTEASAQQLAPGLATGGAAPGGYGYNRTIAPTVATAQSALQVQAKQAVLKQAIKDAQYVSKTNYDNANYDMQQRQRDYQKKEALEAKARQRAADAALYSGGGSTGSNIGGIDESANEAPAAEKRYIGNNDTRGQLLWLAKNSSDSGVRTDANIALKYTGSDGKFGNAPTWAKGALEGRFGLQGFYAKAAAAPKVITPVMPAPFSTIKIPGR